MRLTMRACATTGAVAFGGLVLAAAGWTEGRAAEPTWPHAQQAPVTKPLAQLIPSPDWRAVANAGEPEVPPATHPVVGSVDYGDSGAVFGAQRSGHVHEGQDVFAPAGTPLAAVRDGVVLEAGSDGGRGNHVSVYSKEADQTYAYFHLLSPAPVQAGDRVRGGEKVGELGCTGSCFGDHLHFEVHEGKGAEGRALDPLPLLERWE